eukprot:6203092-Pleurochrysis_carterae.AAC.1
MCCDVEVCGVRMQNVDTCAGLAYNVRMQKCQVQIPKIRPLDRRPPLIVLGRQATNNTQLFLNPYSTPARMRWGVKRARAPRTTTVVSGRRASFLLPESKGLVGHTRTNGGVHAHVARHGHSRAVGRCAARRQVEREGVLVRARAPIARCGRGSSVPIKLTCLDCAVCACASVADDNGWRRRCGRELDGRAFAAAEALDHHRPHVGG